MWTGQIQGGVSIYVPKKHRSQRPKKKKIYERRWWSSNKHRSRADYQKGTKQKIWAKLFTKQWNVIFCSVNTFQSTFTLRLWISTDKSCMYCHSEVILLATVEKPASDYSPSNSPSTNDPSCTLAVGVKLLCQRYYRRHKVVEFRLMHGRDWSLETKPENWISL